MNKEIEYIDIVTELNRLLFEIDESANAQFNYRTNGSCDLIYVDDHVLWNSDDDEREWLDGGKKYEPLLPFLMRAFNAYIVELHSYRFRRRHFNEVGQ